MTDVLTGTVTGANRADLIEKASEEARTYYGTNCVWANLDNPTAETETTVTYGGEIISSTTGFRANYEACEHHNWTPMFQAEPSHCETCGQKRFP